MSQSKWYSINFSNQQILQGQKSLFLRFKNLTSKVFVPPIAGKTVYLLVIPEIINIDSTNTQENEKYKNNVFLNGADIVEMNRIFKNSINLDPEFSQNGSFSSPVTSYGDRVFAINGFYSSPDTYEQANFRFPSNFEINLGISGPFWSVLPIDGKINYRIDYTGNKDLVIKLNFFLTTISPEDPDAWDKYPALLTSLNGNEKPGDVFYDSSDILNPVWKFVTSPGQASSFESPFFSEGPWLGIKNLHANGFYTSGTDWTGEYIDYQETYIFCYKTKNTGTYREKDYWLDKPITEKTVSDTEDSYMLLRTNPKLSGNIKMIVDSSSSLYLESIDANDELSNAKYKKIKVSPNGSYSADIRKVFSTLSPEILYQIAQRDTTYLNTKRNFFEQYDFFYGYGVSQLKSKFYSENFSLFAPLWLRKKLPDFFVIFKTRGPANIESFKSNDRIAIIDEIMQNSKILKTFDMRQGSNIGTYLRNITESPLFFEMPISTNYEKDELTEWHGISYKDGIMTSKGEFLYDFYKTDAPINEFEEYITKGFERNSLISSNLINMEFLFDDPESEDYEINRYFGLYMREIELAQFELFTKAFRYIENQVPAPRKNIDAEPYSLQPFVQTNQNGIIIPVDYYHGNNLFAEPENTGNVKGKLPLPSSIEDTKRVFYVRDRNDNIDRIKGIDEYEFGSEFLSNYIKFSGIELYDTTVDLSKYAGITKLTAQINSELLEIGNAQLVLEINDSIPNTPIIIDGETFEIEWIDINQNRLLWKMIANPTGLQLGDFWDFPLYNPDEFLFVNTFNPLGKPEDIAKALAGCINHFANRIFTALAINNRVYIRANLAGDAGNGLVFRRNLVPVSPINSISFYEILPQFTTTFNSKVLENSSTTGDISIIEKNNGGRFNQYTVKIISIVGDIVNTEIRKNGGLISKWSFDSDSTTPISFKNEFLEVIPVKGTYIVDDVWILEPNKQSIEQRFIGGNSRKRNRALVLNTDAINLNPNDWFQTQKAKYLRLKNWDVQNQKIYNLPNFENPIISAGKLQGYDRLLSHSIIQLEENSFEFYVNLNKKIVAYDTFTPTIGIMSFLDVKDFDFDWMRSDYAYVPNAELFHYFEKYELAKNETREIELYQSYEIESGSCVLEGFDSTINQWIPLINPMNSEQYKFSIAANEKRNFNTFLPAYFYDKDNPSSTIDNSLGPNPQQFNYYFRNYKIIASLENITLIRAVALTDDTVIVKNNFEQDQDLSNFAGFLGLSDFISLEDENKLQELINQGRIERFFYENLSSEYDRLRENFVKDYAVKSRVVPYINKWVQAGTDCRDNRYRLNTSLAFGLNGFAPDTQIREQNARLHTHEFFYLDKFPAGFDETYLPNSRSYFFDEITDKIIETTKGFTSWYELFKDNTQDWFTKYFAIGYPTEYDYKGNPVNKKLEERYVYLNFVNGINEVQGLFRGGKFGISEIDPISNQIIVDSKKYEKYKFAAILRILPLSINSNEPPNSIEFIANDIYKTIVMVTTLYVSDYRIKANEYGFTFLYSAKSSLKNNNVIDKTIGENIIFDIQSLPIIQGYTDLLQKNQYNGLIGSTILDYADIKLNGVFNFSGSSKLSTIRTVNAIDNLNTNIFNPNLEILPIFGENYDIEIEYNTNNYSAYWLETFERGDFSEISQQHPSSKNKTIVNHQSAPGKSIKTDAKNISFEGNIPTMNIPYTYRTSGITNSFINWPTRTVSNIPIVAIDSSTNAWYLNGGFEYIKNRLNGLSFASIFERVNANQNIQYYTINENGVNTGHYKFNFIDFDRITKDTRVLVSEDIDKPEVYVNKGLIGFDLESSAETEIIFRHRGNFEPKTRKIFNYWLREDEIMTNHYNIDFILANTHLGAEYQYFGEIDNLFYSKISDSEILKIATTSSYNSLYPLIDEVAVDKKPYWIFNSNWDNSYYDLYTGINIKNPIEGTNELFEQKSFLGSKVMNTPKVFEIHTFNTNEVGFEIITGLQSTDVSRLSNEIENKSSILQDSNKSKLKIQIDAGERLVREMIENNAGKDFQLLKDLGVSRFANLTSELLLTEISKYIKQNILPLYRVSAIELYEKEPANEQTEPIFRIDLSELQKIQLGYKFSRNTNVTQKSDFVFLIEETLDTKKYKAFSISITLERI
jgi:hypothetical protein